MAIFSFMGGELPDPIKRMLAEADDPEKLRMRHDIQMRDRHNFWDSLTRDQLRYLILELTRITRDDEPASVASELAGMAEGFMMVKFNSCGCGTMHRDPNDFLGDLVREAEESEARASELQELDLEEIMASPFVPPEAVGQFRCTKCGCLYETVEARRADALGASHTNCKE